MVNSYLTFGQLVPTPSQHVPESKKRGRIEHDRGGLVSLGPNKPFRTSRDFGKPVQKKKKNTYILRPVRLRLGEFSEGSDETS